ncbi:mRNA-capping enzyme subunit beta [Mortierella sp. NVP41]|nr:mRNA-capping enzyme subunit beta [Mortierella sp. NVP41]
MSDQGMTKKRPLEEETPQKTSAPEAGGSQDRDGPSNKKPRPEETSASAGGSAATSGTTAAGAAPPPPQPQTQHSEQRRGPPRPTNFFGINVPDDVVQAIADFLFEHCHHPNVEIEAKVGILIDKSTGRRIEMPVKNEVVLMPQARANWYKFSSDMTVAQHAHFNRCLNKSHEMSQQTESKVIYKHTYEIDQFHTSGGPKTRVTKDQKTGQVIPNGIVRKDRIADLDIFSPRRPFDYRVSVNVEVPVPFPGGSPDFERQKDRVSYRLNNLKIDLTQVKTANSNKPPTQQHNYSQMRPQPGQQQAQGDVTHELEIEFVHPEELTRERDIRINSGGRQPDRFLEITGNFINNVRGLIVLGNHIQQHGPPPHQQQQHQQRR